MNPSLDFELGHATLNQLLNPRTWPYLTGEAFWLTNSAYKVAFIFTTPDPVEISRVAVRWGDASYGDATTYRLSLQTVDASGLPTGTILESGAAYVDFTPTGTGNDNKMVWYDLDTPHTTTANELLALVVAYQSGTIDGTHGSQIFRTLLCAANACTFPYSASYSASWTKNVYGPPIFAYGSPTTAFFSPYSAVANTAYSSDSNPDEYAARFIVPTDLCATYHLLGIRITGTTPAAGKTVTLKLYDTDGSTVLAETTFDSDVSLSPATHSHMVFLFTDDPLPLLTAGNAYRVALVPNETSTNLSWISLTLPDENALTAFPLGSDLFRSTRVDGGVWTDDTLNRPLISLILTDTALTADPEPPPAIPAFPFIMLDAEDGITPLPGLTVTAEVLLTGADFTNCTNAPTEVADGLYRIDLESADLAAAFPVLRLTAPDAVTQHLILQP